MKILGYCTEVRFASSFSGGFITAIVVNPPERKLAKCTSVQWGEISSKRAFSQCHFVLILLYKGGVIVFIFFKKYTKSPVRQLFNQMKKVDYVFWRWDENKNTRWDLTTFKVHIFWEGHKILRNLHRRFVLCSVSQIYGGDFAKFCGLLRIYELYEYCKTQLHENNTVHQNWFQPILSLQVLQLSSRWSEYSRITPEIPIPIPSPNNVISYRNKVFIKIIEINYGFIFSIYQS